MLTVFYIIFVIPKRGKRGGIFDGRLVNDGFHEMFRKRCRDFNGCLRINDDDVDDDS